MKKILTLLVLAALCNLSSWGCTNLIVGKKASKDGSVICSYSADSYGAFMNLCHYPAGKHQKGEMRKIYDWDTNKYLGEIPEAPETYNVIGNINEYQLTIGETTYGGREEMVDSTGLIDYGSLIYLTLQRAKTAREAIKVMTTLVETYGYYSEGETFSICDPNEAWVMEMQGCGAGSKSVVWVAQRIPDDCICAHANQSRIRQVNLKDKENVMYSKNMIKFAREKGWFNGKDSEFSWADTYAPADFGGRRFCDARVWSFFNRWHEGGFEEYLPWALGKDKDAKPMPLYIKAKQKLSVQDIQASMRDHYEGTPLALDKANDPGAGIYDSPYRPTPLQFEVDGKKYFNERPISTQQPGFTFVSQMRDWLPRQIGGCLWFGNDDANMIAYTPIYCSMTKQPECYNTPGADATHFSDKNAFWVCNWVSNMVYPRYSMLYPSLAEVRDSLEQSYFTMQPIIEEMAQQALAMGGAEECVEVLSGYATDKAQEMLSIWKELAIYLIVKYNDMAIKPEKDGDFEINAEGLGATVKRPGYPERTKKAIVNQMGDWYRIPQ